MLRNSNTDFGNPFRPGAGHPPPYLAGRVAELREFERLLEQEVILQNLVLTGLRGVGKTVLLDSLRPRAVQRGWAWAGGDLSEPTGVTEHTLAVRLLTDVSAVTSSIVIDVVESRELGFRSRSKRQERVLDHDLLQQVYTTTPGLVADKLKRVLELVCSVLSKAGRRGLVLAYDEAQTLTDRRSDDQFPLSVLLEVVQSLQKKECRLMLVMTGLPTLFPKLVETRTFAERMFRVVFLDRLTEFESAEAVTKPLAHPGSPVVFSKPVVREICAVSGGYPYFLQFISRELYDVYSLERSKAGRKRASMQPIIRKLDSDFFAGRWARTTDRQRELLEVIAGLDHAGFEFSLQDVLAKADSTLLKSFSASHANQILVALTANGLVYKNRHGRYSFAVPLLDQFIRRRIADRDAGSR